MIRSHPQSALRQMVYLVIKELSNIAEDVIMVTSSIMKDMQPNLEVIYRPNAIRALCRVIDVSGPSTSCRTFCQRIATNGLPGFLSGFDDCRRGAVLQSRHRRPQFFHFVSRSRVIVSPSSDFTRRHQAMGERGTRGYQQQVTRRRLWRVKSTWIPGCPEFERHHTVPCSGIAVPDSSRGSNGRDQDDPAIVG